VRTSKKGIRRVCWERERKECQGVYDCIPFLGVSRSLGDFWSFSHRTQKFTVSPKPDVYAHKLDLEEQKFVVIASDGLWNVMSPDEVVRFIWDYQRASDKGNQPKDVVKAVIRQALQRWAGKLFPADNIAVLIAFLSEPKSKAKGKQGKATPKNGMTVKVYGKDEKKYELNDLDAVSEEVAGPGEDDSCNKGDALEVQGQGDIKIVDSVVESDVTTDCSLKSEESDDKAFKAGSQDIGLEPVDNKEIEEIFYDTEDGLSSLTPTFPASETSDDRDFVPSMSDDDDTRDVSTTADTTGSNPSEVCTEDALSFSSFGENEKDRSEKEKGVDERPPRFQLGKRRNADCVQGNQSRKVFKSFYGEHGAADILASMTEVKSKVCEQIEDGKLRLGKHPIVSELSEDVQPSKKFKASELGCEEEPMSLVASKSIPSKESKKIEEEDSGVHSDDTAGSEVTPNAVKEDLSVCSESIVSV